MTSWARRFHWALIGFFAAGMFAACSGTDSDGGSIQSGAAAKVSVLQNPVSFPTTNVGQSVEQPVEISNDGRKPLKLKKIRLIEGNEDDRREFSAGANWQKKATIRPNDQPLELNIRYSPLNSTQDTGEVKFETNAANKSSVTVKLRPAKLAPDAQAPPTVNFSSVQPGNTQWKTFAIQNVGEAALTIDELQLGGSDLFQVTVPAKKPGQGGGKKKKKKKNREDESLKPEDDKEISETLPVTLRPNEKLELRGWFTPEDNNPEKSTLTIFSNDPKGRETVELLGNSKAPCLGLSHEDEVKFDKSSTGKITRKTVTLENCRPRSKKKLKVENIEIADDANGVFGLQKKSLPAKLKQGKTFPLPGGERANFVVTFTPKKNKSYKGKLVIESNDPSRSKHEIKLTGSGTTNECPQAIAVGKVKGSNLKKTKLNTLPLETIELDGKRSKDPDGKVKRYEWSIIDRPADSTARLTPNSKDPTPELYLDLAGKYRVELVVYDNKGASSCQRRAIVKINAIPQEDIHVQLVWDTPSDKNQNDKSGTDLDLHYMHPDSSSWNKAPWDIYWDNETADWGQEGKKKDNPSLDIDDTNGAGPENINHDNPTAGNEYRLGVYYYDDHGFGPSYATVRVYLHGKLAREYKNKFMSGTFDFWKVGLIEWPSGNIYTRDQKFTGFPSVSGSP